jgi:prepilin-type N-terminal cleavage/methylation domain-containing protein
MKKMHGFTLIELMIVVAIIGILAAIAIPKFADLIRKSNEGATKGNLGALRSAMSIYYGEMEGWYPTLDPTSYLLMENGKYLKAIPTCNTTPFHGQSSAFDITIASGGVEGATTGGGWAYQPSPTPGTGVQPWGDVWINCTHTDTKATTWSQY